MTAINAEVTKNPNENTSNLLRRFTRRVQGSGVLFKSRKIRFHTRKLSTAGKKDQALKRLRKTEEYDRLRKLGKIPS